MLSPHILCNIYNGKFQISWHISVCYMAFKMKGEVCRFFMLSGFGIGYPRLILNLCEAGLCIPLMPIHYFSGLFILANFSHPSTHLQALYHCIDSLIGITTEGVMEGKILRFLDYML